MTGGPARLEDRLTHIAYLRFNSQEMSLSFWLPANLTNLSLQGD